MAMINVWYPKEVGVGIEAKALSDRKADLNELGRYLDGRLNVGHSSLLLDRLLRPVYVSWWPQAPATKTPTWRVDVSAEGGNPNVVISIDELDEEAIASWWKKLVSTRSGDRGGYDLVRKNCSSIVAEALSVGGAERLAPKPSVSVWTPARLEDWASELLRRGKMKTNGVFRHGGVTNFIDSTLRRMVSELGAQALDR